MRAAEQGGNRDCEDDDACCQSQSGQRLHERSEQPAARHALLPGTPGSQCVAVWKVQLREHARDVRLDGLWAEAKALRNLRVRPTVAQFLKHALLGWRQDLGVWRAPSVASWH